MCCTRMRMHGHAHPRKPAYTRVYRGIRGTRARDAGRAGRGGRPTDGHGGRWGSCWRPWEARIAGAGRTVGRRKPGPPRHPIPAGRRGAGADGRRENGKSGGAGHPASAGGVQIWVGVQIWALEGRGPTAAGGHLHHVFFEFLGGLCGRMPQGPFWAFWGLLSEGKYSLRGGIGAGPSRSAPCRWDSGKARPWPLRRPRAPARRAHSTPRGRRARMR